MTGKTTLPELTGPELDVMKVLWSARGGGLAAREVHDRLARREGAQGWAYSTTRTVLDRMVTKELVTKSAFHGLNLYAPAISRAAGLARLVRDLTGRVLDMDWAPVVNLFADRKALTAAEVEELSRLLAESEAAGASGASEAGSQDAGEPPAREGGEAGEER